jgi:hypothetical protein
MHHYYPAAMTSPVPYLTIIAYLSLSAADIEININTPINQCLILNNSTSKPHLVDSVKLKKCCPIGWHLESDGCAEGDKSIAIDMVYMVDEKSMVYDLLDLTNYTVHVNTPYQR